MLQIEVWLEILLRIFLIPCGKIVTQDIMNYNWQSANFKRRSFAIIPFKIS